MDSFDNSLRGNEMKNKLLKAFDYALANGYKNTFQEYAKLNYKGYVTICVRCDTKPMSMREWFAS